MVKGHRARHKACPYGGHGGRLRGTMWVSERWYRQHARYTAPTWHGVGGRCGGNPPAQGRAEGPTAQLQWSVISGQWSEGTALALVRDANWL